MPFVGLTLQYQTRRFTTCGDAGIIMLNLPLSKRQKSPELGLLGYCVGQTPQPLSPHDVLQTVLIALGDYIPVQYCMYGVLRID